MAKCERAGHTIHQSRITIYEHFFARKCQANASSRPSRSFLLVIPVIWSRNCPFLKKSSEGIARMLYLVERLWFWSTLTFATLTESAFSFAISSKSGAIILQGPHHSAQKSTITGLSLFVTSFSKLDSFRSIVAEFS